MRINPSDKLNTEKGENNSEQTTKKEAEKKTTTRKRKTPLLDKPKSKKKRTTGKNVKYYTHDGHPLTPKEAKFIAVYVETGNATKAVVEAGYNSKNPRGYGSQILTKRHIAGEIEWRLKQIEDEKIASAEEILKYFTSVMRGEEKDQFGLEAPLSERTRAAQELAKRMIDIPNKLAGKEPAAQVQIVLNWDGMDEEEDDGDGQE